MTIESEQGAVPITEEHMREHGWVRGRECENLANHKGRTEFVCSMCGVHYIGFRFNYCPNCGARVKKGDSE